MLLGQRGRERAQRVFHDLHMHYANLIFAPWLHSLSIPRLLTTWWSSVTRYNHLARTSTASNVLVPGILAGVALFSLKYRPSTIPIQRCEKKYLIWSVDGSLKPSTLFISPQYDTQNEIPCSCREGPISSGILYLHSMSSQRINEDFKEHLDPFVTLCRTCGHRPISVLLVSTMWSQDESEADVNKITKELEERFKKSAPSSIHPVPYAVRFDENKISARNAIDSLVLDMQQNAWRTKYTTELVSKSDVIILWVQAIYCFSDAWSLHTFVFLFVKVSSGRRGQERVLWVFDMACMEIFYLHDDLIVH